MFAFKYIKLQETKQDLQSIRQLGSTLETLEKLSIGEGERGTSISSNNPGQGLRFGYNLNLGYSCSESKSSIIINNPQYSSYSSSDSIIFTKENQQVNKIDLWLLPWSNPFHITNLIYLSDPDRNYYLVSDESPKNIQYVKNIYDTFSNVEIFKNLNKIDINRLNSVKLKSTIIYFTKKQPQIKDSFKMDNTNFVHIDLDKKEISFYEEEWSNPVNYKNEELMYGAFFSDNSEQYLCTTNNAMNKFQDTTAIYIEKARMLNQLTRDKGCNYEPLILLLRKLTNGDYTVLENIKMLNNQGAGCPWLY